MLAELEAIKAVAERRYETGAITEIDLLNSEIAIYVNENNLIDLIARKKAAIAKLNDYLKRPPDAPLEVSRLSRAFVMSKLMTFADAKLKMFENRPEIRSAQESAHAAADSYTFAKMSYLPDFQVTLGATRFHLPSASPISSISPQSEDYFLGVQATFPLWGIFNERQGVISADQNRVVAEDNLTSVQLNSEIALENALANLHALQKKIMVYQNHLLILSDLSFKLALMSYGSGKIDFQELSDTTQARLRIRHDYYGLIVHYMTSYSKLGELIGENL